MPEILFVFQYKFETMFDQLRSEFISVSKEQREKIEHLEAENIVLHKKMKNLRIRLIVTTHMNAGTRLSFPASRSLFVVGVVLNFTLVQCVLG